MKRFVTGFLILATGLAGAQDAAPLRISAKEFGQRRARLAARFPGGVVVVDTARLRETGNDGNTPLFDFKYLTGFHDDRGILVLVDGKPTVFAGDPKGVSGDTGIGEIRPVAGFEGWAREHLSDGGKIYIKLHRENRKRLQAAAPRSKILDARLTGELTALRLIKSPTELRLITRAANATNQAHLAAMKALRPGLNESRIQKVIEKTFAQEGCPKPGFPSICGSGRNGTILHYRKNNRRIASGTLIVCDIGASFS